MLNDTNLNLNVSWVEGTKHVLPPEVRWFGIVVGTMTIIIGTIGNFMTLLVIYRNRSMHTTFNAFIANLCVIDLLTASTMLPFNVASYILGYWPFNSAWTCSLQALYYYCCGYTSIVCLIAISANRLIGICFSNYYDIVFAKPAIYFEILFTWICAPALMCPFIFNDGFGFIGTE